MADSLREFIDVLESRHQLLVVKREVDPRYELNAVVRKNQAHDNLPILFENVRGTRYPVISNTLGNYGIIADMLGVTMDQVATRWAELTSAGSRSPGCTEVGDPPKFESISLDDIPHITFAEKDIGPYLTAGVIVVRDPDTDVVNLSYHRMQIVGERELRCRLSTSGDLYRVQQKMESRHESLQAVVAIGLPPHVMLAAGATISPTSSEYELASRIHGSPCGIRYSPSAHLPIPESTEFLIEGEILPGERRSEGPFGEWMDYYVPPTDNHVFVVRSVLARKDAVFYAISAGSAEEIAMTAVPICGSVLAAVRTWAPSVKDVSCFPLLQFCAIKLGKHAEGQAQRAMLAAFGAEMNRMLYCVTVDEDVDIHDWSDVLWAMATRCRPDRDIMPIPGVPSFARDPHRIHWGRLGVDATKPAEHAADFERKRIPGFGDLDLNEYVTRIRSSNLRPTKGMS